jgi:hypothetical protein
MPGDWGLVMKTFARIALTLAVPLALAACESNKQPFARLQFTGQFKLPAPVIRQPVLPEMLVACRGHVIVPALGMKLVPRGAAVPSEGQFLREERITPPYRIVPPDARLSMDQSPQRLNVELDRYDRIVGLYCG